MPRAAAAAAASIPSVYVEPSARAESDIVPKRTIDASSLVLHHPLFLKEELVWPCIRQVVQLVLCMNQRGAHFKQISLGAIQVCFEINDFALFFLNRLFENLKFFFIGFDKIYVNFAS